MSKCRTLVVLFAILTLAATPLLAQTTQPATQPARGGRGGAMPANPNLPTLWLVGDSTMSNNASGGLGWSAPFIPMFDKTKVNVVNRGIAGRSSRSFQNEGRWDSLLQSLKKGDYVIVQMGHNDGNSTKVDNPNGRPSLPGLGEETQEITKANGQKEVVHTYGWYMRKYINDAKAKGATIIIASSVPHEPKEPVKEGDVETRFVHVGWAEAIAKAENVPFMNINKIILSHYVGMQPDEIRTKYFMRLDPATSNRASDGTHTNPVGAELNAKSVVEGLKQLKDLPLSQYVITP